VLLGQRHSVSRESRWRHNARNLASLAALLLLGLALAAASRVLPWWLYVPLAAGGFGWLFFALLALVVHEASHGMFLLHRVPALRRALNHFCGSCICVPFAIHYTRHWQRGHLLHHRYPMTREDPQRFSVKTGSAFWGLFLGLLLVPGLAYVERLGSRTNRQRGVSSGAALPRFLVFWLSLGSLELWLGATSVLLAQLWGLQVLSALNQLKGALEHGGRIAHDDNPLLRSRTTTSPLLAVLLPFNITLHFEHHLNYTVPWYRLRAYQRDLLPHLPEPQRERLLNRHALRQLSGLLD
jgi:fatty acid desaturase